MYEAFLSCWSEKYRSNALRPETYIHRLIDPNWKPYIQTPPFPEYTSGHSVLSGCCAQLLTQLIKGPYAFIDSTALINGLQPRKFNSFLEAANEASISRYYGGIHYKLALTQGIEQGKKIAQFILKIYNQ